MDEQRSHLNTHIQRKQKTSYSDGTLQEPVLNHYCARTLRQRATEFVDFGHVDSFQICGENKLPENVLSASHAIEMHPHQHTSLFNEEAPDTRKDKITSMPRRQLFQRGRNMASNTSRKSETFKGGFEKARNKSACLKMECPQHSQSM